MRVSRKDYLHDTIESIVDTATAQAREQDRERAAVADPLYFTATVYRKFTNS